MITYKKESHLRSLLKGISWRLIATIDTVLIVLLITCVTGNCSLDNALKIGAIEFLAKFVIYYFHERVWQNLFKTKRGVKREILQKTISWRIIATTMTFLITGSVLESFDKVALFIALTELFTKFILYYLHERLWLKLPLGRIRKLF